MNLGGCLSADRLPEKDRAIRYKSSLAHRFGAVCRQTGFSLQFSEALSRIPNNGNSIEFVIPNAD